MPTAATVSRGLLHSAAVLAAMVAATATAPAHAVQLMQATLTGTVSGGSDAYLNTVYFGPVVGNNLPGLSASVTLIYDADLAPNVPGGAPNWFFSHDPGYPSFVGTVGQSPLISASFSVEGTTVALDVSGSYETASLTATNNPGGNFDAYGLGGRDARRQWCLNDSQCVESVSIGVSQVAGDDLFGGAAFDPALSFTALAAPNRTMEAWVRMFQSPICLAGGTWAGVCPEGRFNDGATHWVEFAITGSSLTVSPLAAVPEPGSWALLLAGGLMLAGWQQRQAGFKRPACPGAPSR